jgi:hypothetical protein
MGCPRSSVAANMLACDYKRKEKRMRRAVSDQQGGDLRCLLVWPCCWLFSVLR